MSSEELATEAMALPLREQVSLAQALWESISAGLDETSSEAATNDAVRRDEEFSSRKVAGRTHEDVMRAARQSIGCD